MRDIADPANIELASEADNHLPRVRPSAPLLRRRAPSDEQASAPCWPARQAGVAHAAESEVIGPRRNLFSPARPDEITATECARAKERPASQHTLGGPGLSGV